MTSSNFIHYIASFILLSSCFIIVYFTSDTVSLGDASALLFAGWLLKSAFKKV
jgi:hypothetical protein